MSALTPTHADIEAGAFQADADQNGNTANPFAMWTTAAMMPMQIAITIQQEWFKQVVPEIKSAAFFAEKGMQMTARRMGLGS